MDFSGKSRLKVVNEYREKYKIISQLLDNNPQLVSLVHQDLAKMLSQSKRGRKSQYTSEQILRSLIVMFIEQDSLRQVVIRIENSEFLRHFVGLGIKTMMDFSFLDKELLEPTLKAHKQLFGTGPDVLATDKGFYENMKQILELEKNITTVSICKKGRRTQPELQRETSEEFKDGRCFRAGCEGSISVLKRVFKLGRRLFKGFKNYAASVGCAVFCHNLVLLT